MNGGVKGSDSLQRGLPRRRGANENTVTRILFFIEHIFGSKSPTPLMPTVAMKGMAKAMERHIIC